MRCITGVEGRTLRLTTKGRYAVTAMLDLAFHCATGPTPLADVACRQGISLSYLEQLFSRLRKKGLVSSVHGPGGGYLLGRPAEEISIAEIVVAVDENVDSTRCAGQKNCQNGHPCLTHDLWSDLSRQIHDFLNNIDLAQVMSKTKMRRPGYVVGPLEGLEEIS